MSAGLRARSTRLASTSKDAVSSGAYFYPVQVPLPLSESSSSARVANHVAGGPISPYTQRPPQTAVQGRSSRNPPLPRCPRRRLRSPVPAPGRCTSGFQWARGFCECRATVLERELLLDQCHCPRVHS